MDPIVIALVGGLSGGLLVKLLDIFVLHPYQHRMEYAKWMREQRLEAFAPLLNSMWLVLHDKHDIDKFAESWWLIMAEHSKALLLLPDNKTNQLIRDFFVKAAKYKLKTSAGTIDREDDISEFAVLGGMLGKIHNQLFDYLKHN